MIGRHAPRRCQPADGQLQHPAVSFAGARVLADGGNAIDATLAMAAMSWLALPGQCGIGGDAFAVVREPDGRVWTSAARLRARRRHAGVLPRPRLTAFRSTARSRWPFPARWPRWPRCTRAARLALADLWGRPPRLAENGLPCSAKTRDDIREPMTPLRADAGWQLFRPVGRPHVGARLRQPDLAHTMRRLARTRAVLPRRVRRAGRRRAARRRRALQR